MNTAPDRKFKTSKLRFISHLVRESLFTPMRGGQHMPLPTGPDEIGITWIGHSSFLIEIAGKRILVDPVFASYLVVLKRRRKPGVRLRDVPPIDLVLLTHAHMDHLNLPSLGGIVRINRRHGAPAPVAIVPKGVQDLVGKFGFREVRALEPWASTTLGSLTITMTPGRHWGARMFNDTERGFGGYVVESGGRSVYHSGDTAYFPGFAAIGQRLHPEIALLPIGAYFPDSFRSVHTSPEDALQAFHDLRAQIMIPMHYGTFRLSLEPMEEPPKRLLTAAISAGVADRISLLEEGRTQLFPPRAASNEAAAS
jgi:L-ascorbate metabolism protein UlaG (beta-lactamase superfamily)